MSAALQARRSLPTRGVCEALGVARSTLYRSLRARPAPFPPKCTLLRRPHPRALSAPERDGVLAVLHEERFVDMAPAAVYATLLDEGRHLCSVRTMYRILRQAGESRERRAVASHPRRTPPQLVATAPDQVWTWDITHLRTVHKGAALKLYVALDLFSRYAVGWYLSESESAAEARHVFQTLARRRRIDTHQLVLHADNGGPMRGQPLADLLETLGIERSHSRPRTSNDNAFSEAQFKTMKYRPAYPRRFESFSHAQDWCREFFTWYNHQHRHEGIALLTPADVYAGRTEAVLAARTQTLTAAYAAHPNRFVKGQPKPKAPPTQVAINPPHRNPSPGDHQTAHNAGQVAKL
jgi:putative transposase